MESEEKEDQVRHEKNSRAEMERRKFKVGHSQWCPACLQGKNYNASQHKDPQQEREEK